MIVFHLCVNFCLVKPTTSGFGYHHLCPLSHTLSLFCASGCFLLLGQKTFPRWLKNLQPILLHDKSSDIGGYWCWFSCLTMLSKAQILSFHSILFSVLAFWLHVWWLQHASGYHRSIYHICHQGRMKREGQWWPYLILLSGKTKVFLEYSQVSSFYFLLSRIGACMWPSLPTGMAGPVSSWFFISIVEASKGGAN